jgi:hypothetical protein
MMEENPWKHYIIMIIKLMEGKNEEKGPIKWQQHRAEESRKWSKISEILPTEKDTIGLDGKRESAQGQII